MRQLFTLIFIFFFIFGVSQTNDNYLINKVFTENQIGKEFVFGNWNENGETETHLTYLGEVKTDKGKIHKIMNSSLIWGLSGRATNRILIFNQKNQYLGNYFLTQKSDLPTELKNGTLIFTNTDSNCDVNINSKINLRKGLPKQFFRECKNGFGDIYTFE